MITGAMIKSDGVTSAKFACQCSSAGTCPWCISPMRVFDQYDIPTAQGQDLDEIGKAFGIFRTMPLDSNGCYAPHLVESDVDLRDRLLKSLRCIGLTPQMADDLQKAKKTHSCECGAHKLGFTERGAGHSSWCPMSK